MNIVIPMSGSGSRFVAAGYKTIKPLIKVFNTAIIKHIVKKFDFDDNFIFICRQEHLDNSEINLKEFLKSLAVNVKILAVANHKLGPVHSILEVSKHLNRNEEVIINYCDFDWRWNYLNFKSWINKEKPDAAICVYSGFQPHYINPAPYAHVKCDQHNLIAIKEKESFTKYRHEEPAASGTFYFKSGKLLIEACNWLKNRKETINGEFYVSLIFNYFPIKGFRCLLYYIDYFMQWGTPEDLQEFLFFAQKVPLNFKEQKIDCNSIILMAGKGNRMKIVDKVKKPYLKVNKSYLYNFCTKNFQSTENNVLAINGDEEDIKVLKNKKIISEVIVGSTKSSNETLLISLEKYKFNNNRGVFIMPCDASINFEWNDFKKILKTSTNLDGVIFSYNSYPYAKWMPEQYGWLTVNKDNLINKIGLKKGWNSEFSNPIITGYFWFPDIIKLKNKLKIFLQDDKYKNEETSIDEFCNYLIEKKDIFMSYPVDDFLCLGIPKEFRAYEYWLKANEISSFR
ncbi:hypothetical protein N9Z35_07365 [Alphaproteobacteria bacterium]|nr:hypothetical protein [Alphaproteobacteria bacterium]